MNVERFKTKNIEILKTKILDLDLKGCVFLNNYSHSEKIAKTFCKVSRLGDGTFWYGMLGAVWLMKGVEYSDRIAYITAGASIGTLIYKALKKKTVRPRPYQVHQVIKLGERPLDHFSFPSGHTLHAVMITSILGYIAPPLLFIMVPFTGLVAASRMILGLHYPTDVLMGALIGGSVATLVISSAPVFHMVL